MVKNLYDDEEIEIISIPILISKGNKEMLFEVFSEDDKMKVFSELSVQLAIEVSKMWIMEYKEDDDV